MVDIFSTTNLDGTAPDTGEQRIITAIAGEALTAGQLVEITADKTVKASTLTATPSAAVIGVCSTNAINGGPVSVVRFGLERLIAYGSVTFGQQVGSGPNGTVQTVTTGSAGTGAVMGTVIGKVFVGASSGGSALVFVKT